MIKAAACFAQAIARCDDLILIVLPPVYLLSFTLLVVTGVLWCGGVWWCGGVLWVAGVLLATGEMHTNKKQKEKAKGGKF